MFFCYLVSRSFAGVLDSVRNVCAFDLGSFIPLLLFLDCLYTHFGHNMWLDWVRFMSPSILYYLVFILIYLGCCRCFLSASILYYLVLANNIRFSCCEENNF
jgi:hypothetical protein